MNDVQLIIKCKTKLKPILWNKTLGTEENEEIEKNEKKNNKVTLTIALYRVIALFNSFTGSFPKCP